MKAASSAVGGLIWPKLDLNKAFMHALVTCKNKEDQIKDEGSKAVTTFLHNPLI